MTTRLLVGDVRHRIAEIPDGSVDLVVTSPPFLALRKYGDNDAEMGSEGTPADFLDCGCGQSPILIAGGAPNREAGTSSAGRASPEAGENTSSNTWRPGHVLDPFAGSGTTLAVASGMGRDVTGIELYPANAWLIRDRVGMFLEVDGDIPEVVDVRPTWEEIEQAANDAGYGEDI